MSGFSDLEIANLRPLFAENSPAWAQTIDRKTAKFRLLKGKNRRKITAASPAAGAKALARCRFFAFWMLNCGAYTNQFIIKNLQDHPSQEHTNRETVRLWAASALSGGEEPATVANHV